MCAGVDVKDVALPTQGTVWSWTVQRYEPKAPFRSDGFTPFAIGYVDLGPVIVEGWLLDSTDWSIGDPVELALATGARQRCDPRQQLQQHQRHRPCGRRADSETTRIVRPL
jgi:uncharacterized OB-fold protein